MIVHKKDASKLTQSMTKKVSNIMINLSDSNYKKINVDKDVRSVKINDQFRMLWRESTKKVCRVVPHNKYNHLIKSKNICNII
jgi:hypothetical protein